MNPGEKREDGYGNTYVFDHRDGLYIHVWRNQEPKTMGVKLGDWSRWKVIQSADQEGLEL